MRPRAAPRSVGVTADTSTRRYFSPRRGPMSPNRRLAAYLCKLLFMVKYCHGQAKSSRRRMNEGESRAREYVEEPDSYMDVADLLGCGTACRGDSGTVRVHERH